MRRKNLRNVFIYKLFRKRCRGKEVERQKTEREKEERARASERGYKERVREKKSEKEIKS